MNRYKKLFTKLNKQKNKGIFVPFVILGDPNTVFSLEIIDTLISSGADALELGIPFSDPLADGHVIQSANLRAFKSGITLFKCFEMLKCIRFKHPNIPIGLLIYANLVYNKGIDNFYHNCLKVGVDSVLIPDLPIEESVIFRNSSVKYNISQVFICPPNANDNLLRKIALYSKSYVYLISRTGVTGNEKISGSPSIQIVNTLKKYNSSPILQGFGISSEDQIHIALKSGVNGVISGSAIINIIEKFTNNHLLMLKKLSIFIRKMKNATM